MNYQEFINEYNRTGLKSNSYVGFNFHSKGSKMKNKF